MFTGCDNFLEGSGLKANLSEEIDYASSSTHLEVLRISPTYQSSGAYCDSIIEITFNKGLNTASFDYEIQDSLSKKDMSSHYLPPEFYSSNKVIKIRPNPQNMPAVSSGSVVDIEIVLSKKIKSEDGAGLSRNSTSYTFRLNSLKDSDSPSIKSLTAYKKPAPRYIKTVQTDKDFADWNDDDFVTNHVNSLYFEIEAMDAGIGCKSLHVKEELLYDVYGEKPVNPMVTENLVSFDFSADADIPGLYKADGHYEFSTFQDGIIKLTVRCADANENLSSEFYTYHIVKDTVLSMRGADSLADVIEPKIFSFQNGIYPVNTAVCPVSYDNTVYKNYLDITKIKTDEIQWVVYEMDNWFINKFTPVTSYSFLVQIGTSLENLNEGTLECTHFLLDDYSTGSSEECDAFYIKFETPDPLKDTFVYITCFDEAGNTYSFYSVIPAKPIYLGGAYYTTGLTSGVNPSLTTRHEMYNNYFYKKKDSILDENIWYFAPGASYWNTNEFTEPNTTYNVIHQTVWKNSYSYLASPLSDVYEITTDADGNLPDFISMYSYNSALPAILFEKSCVSSGVNTAKHTLSVKLKEAGAFNLSDYDAYYLSENNPYSYDIDRKSLANYVSFTVNNDNEYSAEIEYDTEFNKQKTYYIIGIKGSEYNFISLQTRLLDSVSDDNVSPGFIYGNPAFPSDNYYSKQSLGYLTARLKDVSDVPEILTVTELNYAKEFKKENSYTRYLYKNKGCGFSQDSMNYQYFVPFELFCNQNKEFQDVSGSDILKYSVSPVTLGFYGYEYYNLVIPAFYFDDGITYYRVKVTDRNGNYLLSDNLEVCLKRYPEINAVWSTGTYSVQYTKNSNVYSESFNNAITVTFDNFDSTDFKDTETAQILFEYFMDDVNLWSNIGSDNYNYIYYTWGIYNGKIVFGAQYYIHKENDSYSKTVFRYMPENTFVKATLISSEYDSDHSRYQFCSAPSYYYVDTDGNYTDKCKIKNLMDYSGMLTLLCDAPVLVHTVYAHKDIGPTVNEWEARGLQISPKIYTESQNITADIENVPDGYYYTVIAHFADGTSAMSSVRQKK